MKRNYYFILVLTGLFLSACGGGGGGDDDSSSTISYIGTKAEVVITTANAADMAELAMDADTEAVSTGIVIGVVSDTTAADPSRPYTILIAQALAESIEKLEPSVTTTLPGVTETVTETVLCDSGSTTYSITADDVTGIFSGTMTYNDCTSLDVTLSGSVTINGVIDVNTLEFISLSMSFNALTGSDGVESVTMNGDMDFTFSGSTTTMVMNFVVQDNTTGITIMLENYTVVATDHVSEFSANISGRVYHPVHGYGTIRTTVDLRFIYTDEWPYYGQFVIIGVDSSLRVTCINNTSYTLGVDEDGDGIYETVTTEIW